MLRAVRSALLAAAFVFFFPVATFGATGVETLPIGATVSGTLQLGSRQLPLPSGPWVLVAKERRLSTGSAAGVPLIWAYLAQLENGAIARSIFAGTNLEANQGGWARNASLCDRTDTHHYRSDRNYNPRDVECWTINHIGMTLAADAWQVHRDFYGYTEDKRRPATALTIGFYMVDGFDFLQVSYLINPEIRGFDRTPTSDWRGNPWHKDRASEDPKKLALIQELKAQGEQLLPLVRAGLKDQLPAGTATTEVAKSAPTPSPGTPKFDDVAPRLQRLQQLLDQKLITVDEFQVRRKAILDGL